MINKPAALYASLVDVRNIAAHKCLRLEIHVPAEQAPLVLEAFGWPTAVDPVPVAIARLAPAKPAPEPRNAPDKASAPKERRPFNSLALPAQAAMRCNEPEFRRFLAQRDGFAQREGQSFIITLNLDMAADDVREICGVTSRSQITDADESGGRWRSLDREYGEWKHTLDYNEIAR